MLVAIVVLLAGGLALAASGVGTLVVGGDEGTSARAVQQPLGSLGAASPTAAVPGGIGERSRRPGGEQPGGSDVTVPAGAVGEGRLPFAGLLAIAVLLAGAAFLLGGAELRHRFPRPPSWRTWRSDSGSARPPGA